jgi:hypothetical protein
MSGQTENAVVSKLDQKWREIENHLTRFGAEPPHIVVAKRTFWGGASLAFSLLAIDFGENMLAIQNYAKDHSIDLNI